MTPQYLIIQNRPNKIKSENIISIDSIIKKYFNNSINFIILPEFWNCLSKEDAEYFIIDNKSPCIQYLYELSLSKPLVYIISGGIYEKDEDGCYTSTSSVWKAGVMIHIYRQPLNVEYYNSPLCFDTEFGRIGLCNKTTSEFPCFYAENKVNTIIFFDLCLEYYGKRYWMNLLTELAIESKCNVIGSATAPNLYYKHFSYGHSCVIDSKGIIHSQIDIGDTENIIISKI